MARSVGTKHEDLMRLLNAVDDASGEIGEITAGAAGNARHEKADRAAKPARDLRRRYQKATAEALEVVLSMSRGFREAGANSGPVMSRYEKWAAQMTKHDHASYIVRIFVLLAAAELEHFMRELARWWLTPAQVKRAQLAPGPITNLSKDPIAARTLLIDAACSNSRPPEEWPDRVRVVFGLQMPPELATSFVALIRWRHEFSHRNNEPLNVDWMEGPDFMEVVLTWWLSSIALSDMLVARRRGRAV
jgi:hypothetical protein